MYRSRQERSRAIRIVIWAVFFVLVTAMSGCGLVADGVNHIRAIQLPPGDMYSPEFYRTATVEEVKKAIGSRSLADESYSERSYSANTEGRGFLAALDGKIKSVQSVFIPMSSVDENAPTYPLQIAVGNTPYPEVVTALIDAGADPDKLHVAQYVCLSRANPEISRILLARCSPAVRCEALIALAGAGNRAMVDYCLGLEGVTAACFAGTEYPLKSALRGKKTSMAAHLLERGAVLPDNADGRLELLAITLRMRNSEAFWLLTGLGLDCSQVGKDGKNGLLPVAVDVAVNDESVLLHLARTVPLGSAGAADAGKTWAAACEAENPKVLDTLLRRNNGLPKDVQIVMAMLKAALKKKNGELFWKLVAKGADCSVEDSPHDYNIMYVASWSMRHDTKIIQYLAEHVSVMGESGSEALRRAVQIGYAGPVRTLLERGAVPADRELFIPGDAPEREAIQAVLEGKGIASAVRW